MGAKTSGKSLRFAISAIATQGVIALGLPVAYSLLAQPMHAQLLHPTDPLPSFEVATVKPLGPRPRFMVGPLGSQQIVHVVGTELALVVQAFNVPSRSQITTGLSLGFGWSDTKPYVIEAKIPDDVFGRMQTMTASERKEQAQLMLQALLAERFKLQTHFHTQDMPVYEIQVDKDGPKLPAPNEPPLAAGGGWAIGPKGDLRVRNMKLDDLLRSSIFELGDRPIVNQTGLTGTYNLTLHWKPPATSTAPNMDDGFFPTTDDNGPSIFTVVREQLGLRLVPARGSVEVVVIDHIEQPSAN